MINEEFHLTSCFETKKMSMVWQIHCISFSHMAKNKWLTSPTFGKDKSTWELHVYLGDSEDSLVHAGVFAILKEISNNLAYKLSEYRFGLRNRDGVDRFVCTGKELQEKLALIIEQKELLGKLKEELLPDDTLTMFCEVVFESSLQHLSEKEIDYGKRKEISNISRKKLATDLNCALNDKSYCDVILKSSDQKEFSAHLVMLHARSPVFAAMFQHDMVEKKNGEVYIQDMDGKTLQALLGYIYTGEVQEWSQKKASMLYAAADKYQMSELKVQCSNYMVENLTIGNVCDALLLAKTYSEEDLYLYKHALEVLKENKQIVVSSKSWKELILKNTELAAEIVEVIHC